MKKIDSLKIRPIGIIGGGPGGVTSAIYLKRANLKPLILTNELIGGKIAKTLIIENYPGFKSISGPLLCKKFLQQVNFLKIPFLQRNVTKISRTKKGIFVVTTNQEKFYFQKLIVATGSKERKHELKNLQKFEGRGLSYCSSCDGYFFKNKIISVIGSGNTAVEETKVLAQIGKEVHIINLFSRFNAEAMLVDEIKQLKNVFFHNFTKVIDAIPSKDQTLNGLKLQNIKNNQIKILKTDGLFIFIGSIPNNNFFDPSWDIFDEHGYVKVDQNFKTNISNLYVIGDLVSNMLQQYTTVVASGTIAAKNIIDQKD